MNTSAIEAAKSATKKLIDELKAICTSYGLGNSGNEYKIITQVFLYKFLNDKFFYSVKRIEGIHQTLPGVDLQDTRTLEEALSSLDDNTYAFLMFGLDPSVAQLKPKQYISYLYNQRNMTDFHTTFDNALLAIADENKEVFGISTGENNRVKLFEPLSNYIVDPERRDSFANAIIDKLVSVSFEDIFDQKYDFYADIFEYLIGDYNKDSGKYGEYYTPHSIASIIASILAKDGDRDVTIYEMQIPVLIKELSAPQILKIA